MNWSDLQPYTSSLIAAVIVSVLAAVFWVLATRVARGLYERTKNEVDDVIFRGIRGMIVLGILLSGLYQAIVQLPQVQAQPGRHDIVVKTAAVIWLVYVVLAALRIVNATCRAQMERASLAPPEEAANIRQRALFIKKLLTIVVLVLGFIYGLTLTGTDISPLLAGGAVTGLVIGWALQDTLSNLFAGIFLNLQKNVAVGDYVQLETGEEGVIVDIGWQYTIVRLWTHAQVTLPNKRVSNSKLINFRRPSESTTMPVELVLDYLASIEDSEAILIQTAKDVLANTEGGDPEFTPKVIWLELGDSGVKCSVTLRVLLPGSRVRVRSEFLRQVLLAAQTAQIALPKSRMPERVILANVDAESGAGNGN